MSLRDLINPIASPEVGLLLFVGIFLIIIVWVLTRRRKDIDKQARIPLHDEPVGPRVPPVGGSDETRDSKRDTNTQEDSA